MSSLHCIRGDALLSHTLCVAQEEGIMVFKTPARQFTGLLFYTKLQTTDLSSQVKITCAYGDGSKKARWNRHCLKRKRIQLQGKKTANLGLEISDSLKLPVQKPDNLKPMSRGSSLRKGPRDEDDSSRNTLELQHRSTR